MGGIKLDEKDYTFCLPFVALSYFWRTPAHPDPNGETLSMVCKALKFLWNDFEAMNYSDMSMFIDWCSLFQAPRTQEQQTLFLKSLANINLYYAHQATKVFCVTSGEADGLTYWDKGWTSFEYNVSTLIKCPNSSGKRDWPLFVDVSRDDFGIGERDELGRCKKNLMHRPVPAEPLAFYAGHEYSTKIYTNGADRDKIVAPK